VICQVCDEKEETFRDNAVVGPECREYAELGGILSGNFGMLLFL
jgi:hypothetical protein